MHTRKIQTRLFVPYPAGGPSFPTTHRVLRGASWPWLSTWCLVGMLLVLGSPIQSHRTEAACGSMPAMPMLLSGTSPWSQPEEPTVDASSVAIDPGDHAAIEAMNDPAELVAFARRLVIRRRESAARMAIAKACRLEPELLEDDKRASPRSWRSVWFGHRAELRTERLAPNDAVGRVAIANWLGEAGLGREARTMLRAALKIDPALPEALELAEAWYLFGGGPFQFDLTLAATENLFLDSIFDEGEQRAAARGRQWMLLPFAYRPDEESLDLQGAMLRVIADARHHCRVIGMMLIEAPGSGTYGHHDTAPMPRLSLQSSSEPVWERLRFESDEAGTARVIGYNLLPPPSRRAARSGTRASRTGVPIGPASGRLSGYAAFVLDIPENAQQLDIVFRDEIGLTLSVPQLKTLSADTDAMPPGERRELVEALSAFIGDSNPAMVSAAVARLGMIRWNLARHLAPSSGHEPLPSRDADETLARIEDALIAAAIHKDTHVRQTAFQMLVHTPTLLSRGLLTSLSSSDDPHGLMSLLDQVENTVASAGDTDASTFRHPGAAVRVPEHVRDFAELEIAPISDNVFLLLSACLNSGHEQAVAQSLDILLADGSRQSALVLMEASAGIRALLIDRLADLEEGAFKSALFGIIASKADTEMLARLLDACGDMEPTILDLDAPLLTLLRRPLPFSLQARIVGLLAGADLSNVGDARAAEQVWIPLTNRALQDATLATAVLELAGRHFDSRYQSPVPRETRAPMHTGYARTVSGDTFTKMLAMLATGEHVNRDVAAEAARLLLKAGHVEALRQEVLALPANQQVRYLDTLLKNADAVDNTSLAIFLAGFVAHEDPQVARPALAGLGHLYQAADADKRREMNLFLKLSLPVEQLGMLSLADDDRLARDAGSLLREVGYLTPGEWNAIAAHPDRYARRDEVVLLSQNRASFPAGAYACRLYVDLDFPADPRATDGRTEGSGWMARLRPSPDAIPSEPEGPVENVLWIADEVRIEPAGDKAFRIMCAERSAAPPDAAGGQVEMIQHGQLPIDGRVFLRSAINRAEKEGHPLASFIDRRFLDEPVRAHLGHVQLGTWAATLSIQSTGEPDRRRPIRIREARLFLEPITLDRPTR